MAGSSKKAENQFAILLTLLSVHSFSAFSHESYSSSLLFVKSYTHRNIPSEMFRWVYDSLNDGGQNNTETGSQRGLSISKKFTSTSHIDQSGRCDPLVAGLGGGGGSRRNYGVSKQFHTSTIQYHVKTGSDRLGVVGC
jgi:hypothetical protein